MGGSSSKRKSTSSAGRKSGSKDAENRNGGVRPVGSHSSASTSGATKPGTALTSAGSGLNPLHRVRSMARNHVSMERRTTRTGTFGALFGRGWGADDEDDEEDGRYSGHGETMSSAESAFLPRDVRERLIRGGGHLPPVPALFPRAGAVLFVDISGFTALGEKLRAELAPDIAADRLQRQITYVLNDLTRVCIAAGGDVAKFAGDALLCTFTAFVSTEEECLLRAQNCAVEMLMTLRKYNLASGNNTLQVHGGIAKGTVLHFHLGSLDDDLRWYLVAGDAVASATSLVDRAPPGEILMLEETLNGMSLVRTVSKTSTIASTNNTAAPASSPPPAADKEGTPMGIMGLINIDEDDSDEDEDHNPAASNHATSPKSDLTARVTPRNNGTTVAGVTKRVSRMSFDRASDHFRDRPGRQSIGLKSTGSKSSLVNEDGTVSVPITVITADTPLAKLGKQPLPPLATPGEKALYDIPLPGKGNAYIPKALRFALRKGLNTSEMRANISIVFVGLEELSLTDAELASHSMENAKLDALNEAFVAITRVTHMFHGEVRDLLFDDKGCIFIAVFGAHSSAELSTASAAKAAMAVSHEYPRSRVGVSVGTCFVGMCGSSKRHDFIVMGHDVNMAARYMLCAQPGEVLVSAQVAAETKGLIGYEEVSVNVSKKDKTAGGGGAELLTTVFRPLQEIARRPSFLAQYRYGLRDKDMFVGRAVELALIEQTIQNVCFGAVEEPSSHRSNTTNNGNNNGGNNNNNNSQHKSTGSALSRRPPMAVDTGGSGVIMLEAQPGMGKSAFVSRARQLGKGRIKIASSAAFSLEQEHVFFVFRHLMEAYTGLRPDMSPAQIRRVCEDYGGDDALDVATLAELLPYLDPNYAASIMVVNNTNNNTTTMNTNTNGVAGDRKSNLRLAAATAAAAGGDARGSSLSPQSFGGLPRKLNSASSSGRGLAQTALIDRVGREVLKVLSGFRGELTIQQVLAGEPTNGALLIIEDVQWMDVASLQLLQFLIEHLDALHGVVLLLTTRSMMGEGLRGSHASSYHVQSGGNAPQSQDAFRLSLVDECVDLAKTGPKNVLNFKLYGLDRKDCNLLVARVLNAESDDKGVDPAVLAFIYEKTDGFPLYLTLLLEWIKEHKLIKARESDGVLDWVAPDTPATANFPNTLADTMITRLDRLDPQARNLVKMASTMDVEFDAASLCSLANLDMGKSAVSEADTLAALEMAMDLGLLSVKRTKGIKKAAHKWRFKHDAVRAAVLSLNPEARIAYLRSLINPMRQEIEKKKLIPLFAGFLGEVDS